MAIKRLTKNVTLPTEQLIFTNGSWQWVASPRTLMGYEEVDAEFHRPYPDPLTPTWLQKSSLAWSTQRCNTDLLRNAPVGSCRVPGTTIYSYDGNPTDAQFEAALAKAGRRFTGSFMDLGETISGLRETVSMVDHRLASLGKLFSTIEAKGVRGLALEFAASGRGSHAWASAKTNTRQVANGYLEAIFGWMPVINDVYTGLTKIERDLNSGDTVSFSASSMRDAAEGNMFHGKWVHGHRVRLGGTLSNPNLRRLNSFGLANPALTAWQVVPLSFILDWAVNASDILGYVTWNAGLSDIWGTDTRVFSRVSEQYTEVSPQSYAWCYLNQQKVVTRVPFRPSITVLPLVSQLRKPTFGMGAITASLLAQRYIR